MLYTAINSYVIHFLIFSLVENPTNQKFSKLCVHLASNRKSERIPKAFEILNSKFKSEILNPKASEIRNFSNALGIRSDFLFEARCTQNFEYYYLCHEITSQLN